MEDPIANRPPPAATGTLGKTPLVHLLVYALGKKLSGTIEFASPDGGGGAVFFVEGQPARARTSARGLHGKPSEGEELRRKLRQVAALPATTEYAYYAGFDVFGGPGPKGVDPVSLLWGLLRDSPPWDHVDTGLARLGGSGVRLAAGADVGPLALAGAESRAILNLQGRSLTPAGLAAAGGLDEATTRLLVYLLLLTKKVDVLAADAAPVTPSSPAPAPAEVRPRPPSMVSMAAVVAPPPSLAPELAKRWAEIIERASLIDRTDYFQMLDLARDATKEQIDAAYFALAKRWHPDRLPPELARVKDSCARVFARMSEAHATLGDEEKRKRYMRLLADGSGSPETQETVAKVVEAATNFQKAEVLFKRGDPAQAEAFARKAVEADPTQADYHAFLAWLIALKPESQSPEKTAECIALLTKATGISAKCERAFFWRGMLYKRTGKNDLALADFRRAAELNPRNIDAAREVRLHQMRTGQAVTAGSSPSLSAASTSTSSSPPKPDEPERPSLLGRLFKKS
jgi:curved DNA-binding protein CbpA